jgi:hypothetical protein
MQRLLLAAVLAMTCLVAATPGFARGGGFGHGGGFARGTGGFVRNPTALFPNAPQGSAVQSRIPAPLSAPSAAPTINGPMSQPAFRGLTGIGQ